MALHDVPNGVLRHLDRFLGEVAARRPPAAGLPAVVRSHHLRAGHRAARGFRQRSSGADGAWKIGVSLD